MAISDDALALFVNDLQESIGDMTWGGRSGALFALLNKSAENGANVAQTVEFEMGNKAVGTYANALAAAGQMKRVQFLIPFYEKYGLSSVPITDNNLSKGPNSAAQLLLRESKNAINKAKGSIEKVLFADGYGTRATIVTPTNTSGSTWTITFATKSEARKFAKDDQITQKDTAAGTLQTGYGVVTAVTPGSKRITITAVSSFTPTAGYKVGYRGDQVTGSTFVENPGLPAIFPPPSGHPVSSTLFWNVDRSQNDEKLAGHYYDGTGDNALEAVLELEADIIKTEGAEPDTVICGVDFKKKIIALCRTQQRYCVERVVEARGLTASVTVTTIQGIGGLLNIVECAECPEADFYVVDSNDLCVGSPENMPIRPMGGGSSAESPISYPTDSATILIRFMAQMAVWPRNPGYHGHGIVTP